MAEFHNSALYHESGVNCGVNCGGFSVLQISRQDINDICLLHSIAISWVLIGGYSQYGFLQLL